MDPARLGVAAVFYAHLGSQLTPFKYYQLVDDYATHQKRYNTGGLHSTAYNSHSVFFLSEIYFYAQFTRAFAVLIHPTIIIIYT